MIDESRFIDSSSELIAASKDEDWLITDLIYYFTDGFRLEKEELPEPFSSNRLIFPSIEDVVREHLRDREKAETLLSEAKTLWNKYKNGEIEGHWKYACEYERVDHLEAYLRGRNAFNLPTLFSLHAIEACMKSIRG